MITTPKTETITTATAIHRQTLIEFVKALGFDPNEVSKVEITAQSIFITTYLRDASGQVYLARNGMNNVSPATTTTHVAVQD